MEKREKDKTAAQVKRKSRLSKQPPPASSADALRKAGSAVPDPRGRPEDRPASEDVTSPDKEPRKSRSRSSSFASLIRSPLGFRRHSVDLAAAEPEFIGGIKLEHERHLANERALDQQAGDDARRHPALRHDAANDQSSEPLASPSRTPGEAKSPARKHYPPITRHEKYPRTRTLVSPTAPAVPDLSKIDRWRARVGLRSVSQPLTPTSAELETQPRDADAAGEHERRELVERQAVSAQQAPMDETHHIASAGVPPAPEEGGEEKGGRGLGLDESIRPGSRGDLSAGYRTAPSTPPNPPLRSPRRGSLSQPDDPRLHVEAADSLRVLFSSDAPPVGHLSRRTEARKSMVAGGSAPTSPAAPGAADKQGAKPAPPDVSAEAVQRSLSPVLRSAEAKAEKSPTEMSWTTHSKSLPVSSPYESGSDEFHSPSPPSSPATSRSESDKMMSKPNHGAKSSPSEPTAVKAPFGEAHPAALEIGRADGKEDDGSKDHEFASCCESTGASPSIERRSLLPIPNRQSPAIKDKGASSRLSRLPMAPGNQSQKAPQPRTVSPRPEAASYLEGARRMPPAPTTRGAKPQLGPPASFALPGDLPNPPTTRSEVSRLSNASQYPLHMTTAGVSLRDHDPIAKMFVECCHCKFYHDMPSNLYEAMANPESALSGRDTMGYAGAISMTVRCPWCKHEMSTRCCAGLAAMVYVTERLH